MEALFELNKTDGEIKNEIETLINGDLIGKLSEMEKTERQDILREINKIERVTQGQIPRATGISPNTVFKELIKEAKRTSLCFL